MAKILPLLTQSDPSVPSFHVVAYSLPGFGFSEGAKKKGFGVAKMAEVGPAPLTRGLTTHWPFQVGHKLMLALGYEQYGKFIQLLLSRRYSPTL